MGDLARHYQRLYLEERSRVEQDRQIYEGRIASLEDRIDRERESARRREDQANRLIDDQDREIHELRELLETDQLTRVHSRYRLGGLQKSMSRKKHRVRAIALVDINDFKIVNDTYGHTVGDTLLYRVACHLKGDECTVVRMGGDEFLIVLTTEVAIKRLIDTGSIEIPGTDVSASLSIGIVRTDPDKEYNLTNLICQADALMYECKWSLERNPVIAKAEEESTSTDAEESESVDEKVRRKNRDRRNGE